MNDVDLATRTNVTLSENAMGADSNSLSSTGDSPSCIVRRKGKELIATSLESASHTRNIQELELRNLQLDQVVSLHLDRLFSGCQDGFHSLRLVSCALSDKFFSFATERLAQNSVQLTQFAMKNCSQLSMTSLISMSTFFSQSLVSLELSSCKLARQAGIILSQSLPSCTALRKLVLADNNLRDGGLRAIVDALKVMYSSSSSEPISINTLGGLDGHGDGYTGSDHLRIGLEELDISKNGITAAGFGAFSHVPIRNLIASDNAIESIGPFLLTNASIRELDLSRNLLSDEGAHELISTLFREQTSLERLDLRKCALSPSSTSFLRKTLRQSIYCPLKELLLDEQQGDNNQSQNQCLKEILETGAQKYPHLAVRLSKAPVTTQESRQLGPKRRSSDTGLNGSEALVFPLAKEEVQDTVVATITAAKASLTIPPVPVNFASTESARAIRQQQQLSIAPLIQNSHEGPRDAQQQPQHPPSSLPASQLQHVDVEYIVSKTIECMNQNFEQRLGLFLMKMETQQQEKNASQVQFLAAKVDACERAIPRLEARLDVLSDRVAVGKAQLTKLQNEFQLQLHQVRQDVLLQQAKKDASNVSSSSNANSNVHNQQLQLGTLSSTTPLSLVMQNQVEDFVTTRARASEQFALSEIQKLRRETNPQAIVDAVSSHLTQFKQEFDANQSSVLCRFTESIVKDSVRLDERMGRVEEQIESLETVIQAEQQASLLALEAISDAFSTTTNSSGDEFGDRPMTPSTAGRSSTPTRSGGGPSTMSRRR